MNTAGVKGNAVRESTKNEEGTGHSIKKVDWTNSGLTLTQDGNIGEEEFIESDDDSMIVTFQFNQLHDHSRRLIEDRIYTNTNILINNRST